MNEKISMNNTLYSFCTEDDLKNSLILNLDIGKKVIKELMSKGVPNYSFLFSKEVLDISFDLFIELLNQKKRHYEMIENVQNKDLTYEMLDKLFLVDIYYSIFDYFSYVLSEDQIRDIFEKINGIYQDYNNYLSYNTILYQKIKYLYNNGNLNSDQKRSLEISIKHYENRGIHLSTEKIDKIKEINLQLQKLSTKFRNNVIDSQNEFEYFIKDFESIKDLPKNELEIAKDNAQKKGLDGYLFVWNHSNYKAIMDYCSNSDTRKDFFEAGNQFASSGKYDNRELILQILSLKDTKAQILGYNNFAEFKLSTKMAQNPDTVFSMFDEMSKKAIIKINQEVENLKTNFGLDHFNRWDYEYYLKKYIKQNYKIDYNEISCYFEFNDVLKSMFDLANNLFGLSFEKCEFDYIDKDSFCFKVFKGTDFLGYYILDPFYRAKKKDGAFACSTRSKHSIDGEIYYPIVYNVSSFQKSLNGKTLLKFEEIKTMFHEFGHALHGLVGESVVSGINWDYVEGDFIEVPSQLMECWIKQKQFLKSNSSHIETKESLSDDVIDILNKLENISKGFRYSRQIGFIMLDMNLHTKKIPISVEDLDKFVLSIVNNYSNFKYGTSYKMYTGFNHIFSSGYSAGYYTYIWSEIFVANIFSKFKINGIFDSKIGEKYYNSILSQGARKPAMELFKDFMGTDVDMDMFYDYSGLV